MHTRIQSPRSGRHIETWTFRTGRDGYEECNVYCFMHYSLCRCAKDHCNLLHSSPLLKKACVRQVVLDKWFPPKEAAGNWTFQLCKLSRATGNRTFVQIDFFVGNSPCMDRQVAALLTRIEKSLRDGRLVPLPCRHECVHMCIHIYIYIYIYV